MAQVGPGEAHEIQLDRTQMAKALTGDRCFSISCKLGVHYPTLLAMMNQEDLHLRNLVPLSLSHELEKVVQTRISFTADIY